MSLSKEEILNAIAEMTVLEVTELVSAMEEKFGVSAAASVVAAPVAGAAGVEAVEEQTEFDVMLTAVGDKKVNVLKTIRSVTGLGLKEAKDLLESCPCAIKEGLSKEEAAELKKQFEEAGATVEVK